MGGLETLAGLAMVDVGAGLSVTGLGAVIGLPLLAAGVDIGTAGTGAMIYGTPQKTPISLGLEKLNGHMQVPSATIFQNINTNSPNIKWLKFKH